MSPRREVRFGNRRLYVRPAGHSEFLLPPKERRDQQRRHDDECGQEGQRDPAQSIADEATDADLLQQHVRKESREREIQAPQPGFSTMAPARSKVSSNPLSRHNDSTACDPNWM